MLVKACKVDELKDDSMLPLTLDNKKLIVAKHDGKVYAFDAYCPHRYYYLYKGWFKDNRVVCPLHEFEYDLDTGKLMDIGEQFKDQHDEWKKSDDLKLYKVIIKDGYVYVDI